MTEQERESFDNAIKSIKGLCKNAESASIILRKLTDILNEIKAMDNANASESDIELWFNKTYEIYPRKVSKVQAKATFEHKLRNLPYNEAKDKARAICLAVMKQCEIWQKENDFQGRKIEHIPYFSTWLNDNVEDSKYYRRKAR